MTLSFARPLLLLALVIPLALLVWVWRRRSGRIALPMDHVVSSGHGRGWGLLLDLGQSLPPLLLAGAIILLAGPQRFSAPKTKRALTNIEYCVDVSCSMMASFGEGSRYDASMEAINRFLDYRRGDAFGLTIFGNSVLHWVPLTSDVSALRCAPPFLRPEKLPAWFGGTEIGKALLACMKVLTAREEGDRMIILISDGYSWDLSNGRDEEIATRLRENGVEVFAIHVADGSPPEELVMITSRTGGALFAAGDPAALESVFRRIDAMKVAKLEKTAPEALDYFEPYCVAILSLLSVLLGFGFGLRYTPW